MLTQSYLVNYPPPLIYHKRLTRHYRRITVSFKKNNCGRTKTLMQLTNIRKKQQVTHGNNSSITRFLHRGNRNHAVSGLPSNRRYPNRVTTRRTVGIKSLLNFEMINLNIRGTMTVTRIQRRVTRLPTWAGHLD